MTALYDLFLNLDRCGPGDRDSLDRAIGLAGTPPGGRVLDAGCGTGADLPGLLAAVPDGQVVAVDAAAPFIARVRAQFPAVRAEVADMADPPGGPFDLIWSAGAVYHLGVTAALTGWRRHLAPGGRVAFTDLRWTGADRPAEAVAFWAADGLELTGLDRLRAEIAEAGYRELAGFWLPRAAWAAYYDPLDAMLETCPDRELADGFRAEIALWRRHGDAYGYWMSVVAPD